MRSWHGIRRFQRFEMTFQTLRWRISVVSGSLVGNRSKVEIIFTHLNVETRIGQHSNYRRHNWQTEHFHCLRHSRYTLRGDPRIVNHSFWSPLRYGCLPYFLRPYATHARSNYCRYTVQIVFYRWIFHSSLYVRRISHVIDRFQRRQVLVNILFRRFLSNPLHLSFGISLIIKKPRG